MVSICGKQFLAYELHHWDKSGYPLFFTIAENQGEKQQITKETTGGSQERPEMQEQLDSNRGGEPNRDAQRTLGIWSLCFRGGCWKNHNCARSQAETQLGREKRMVCPRDVMRNASCSTRGSQQQMEVFKQTQWAANGKAT